MSKENSAVSVEEQHRIMLETPIPRLVTSLAIPTMLSQLVTVVYNTADTWFVSQISTGAAAAVGIAFSVQSLIQALGFSVGMGAQSLISRYLGAEENEKAQTVGNSAIAMALSFGILIGVFGLIFLEPLMILLGSTASILPYAKAYTIYIMIGAPIMCPTFVLNSLLRAEGKAKFAAVGLTTGGLLNVVLDPFFIFTCNMQVGGAALATVLSQLISMCILLSFFLRGKSIIKLRTGSISGDLRLYWKIITTGMPTLFRQGMASVASAMLNRAAAGYGDAAVAAVTIANKVYLLVRHMIMGIGQGFQPVAGYNYGAGNRKRTRDSFLFACAAGTVICTAAGLLIGGFTNEIVGWFRDDAEVIRIGGEMLFYGAAVMPFMAYSTYVNQLYQCLGFKWPATFLALCRQGFCFVPLILLLPAHLGCFGVELAQPGADFLTFLISVPFQIRFFRKRLRMQEKKTVPTI